MNFIRQQIIAMETIPFLSPTEALLSKNALEALATTRQLAGSPWRDSGNSFRATTAGF